MRWRDVKDIARIIVGILVSLLVWAYVFAFVGNSRAM